MRKLKHFSKFKIIFCIILMTAFHCCQKEKNNGFISAEESIKSVQRNFPIIDIKLEKLKEVNLDSLSISLYKNPKKNDYDEILVFRKKNKYFAIPFFSNMYYDFWNYNNEKQKQLFPKTQTTFEEQLKKTINELNLSPKEFGILIEELMKSVLNTETSLELKPKIFKNYIYTTFRVDKYKTEEIDSCTARTEKVYEIIQNESKKTIRYNEFFLDAKNGRIYEVINDARNKGELKFRIKVYRIDCFMYPLNI